MKDELLSLFETDLAKLRREVEAFSDETVFWSTSGDIRNSPGNLTLHLLGNLNHYIGAKLGNTGYVRDRPLEFSSDPIPRGELLERIDRTAAVVTDTIKALTDDHLRAPYAVDSGEDARAVATELVRILTHLNYHLGQINYHRRLSQ